MNGTSYRVWKHVICAKNVGAGSACEYGGKKIKWRDETEVPFKVLRTVLQDFKKSIGNSQNFKTLMHCGFLVKFNV